MANRVQPQQPSLMDPGQCELDYFRSLLTPQSIADLGLPVDGSDSLFLPLELANMFLPSSSTYQFALPPLPDSEDFGAEAW